MAEEDVVIFTTSSGEFAAGVESLVEIIRMVEIRPLPETPIFLRGVVDYRGEIIPVCDLNVLLGGKMQECGLETPILIVNIEGHIVGFIVEKVVRVMGLTKKLLRPVSQIRKNYVTRAFEYNETVHLMINLAEVFKAGDKEILFKATGKVLSER